MCPWHFVLDFLLQKIVESYCGMIKLSELFPEEQLSSLWLCLKSQSHLQLSDVLITVNSASFLACFFCGWVFMSLSSEHLLPQDYSAFDPKYRPRNIELT